MIIHEFMGESDEAHDFIRRSKEAHSFISLKGHRLWFMVENKHNQDYLKRDPRSKVYTIEQQDQIFGDLGYTLLRGHDMNRLIEYQSGLDHKQHP